MPPAIVAADLPFLIVHGAVVWKFALALLVIGSMYLGNVWRRRGAASQARYVVGTRLAQVGGLAPGRGFVRGRLRGGVIATFTRGRGDVYHRSEQLWLDVDGERVALVGPVCVDHGTRMWTSWRGGVRTDDPALTEIARSAGAHLVRAVVDGDEVVVNGVLARAAAADGSATWTLSAPTNREATLVAVEPRARPEARSPLLTAFLALLIGGGWYVALHQLGEVARDRMDDRDDEVSVDAFGAYEIGAALPGSRDYALGALHRHLDNAFERTGDNLPLVFAIDTYRDDCPYDGLIEATRFDDALAAAQQCGTPRQVANAFALLGRFDDAAHALPVDDHSKLASTIAIAQGRWHDAAVDVETSGDSHAAQDPCLGALFRAWAGESDTFMKVANAGSSTRCAVLAALLEPPAQQRDALAAISYGEDELELKNAASLLWLAAGGVTARGALVPVSDMYFTDHFHESRLVALISPTDLSDLDDTRGDQSKIRAQLGELAIERGDLSAATAELALMPAGLADSRSSLSVAIAVRDPASKPESLARSGYAGLTRDLQRRLFMGEAINEGDMLEVESACQAQYKHALETAQAGDGAELTVTFRDCRVTWDGGEPAVLGVLRRVRTHRAELAAQLRRDRDQFTLNRIPLDIVAHAAVYRDMSRLIGDDDVARRWQDIVARDSAVLADRQKLIAFVFWSQL